MGAQEQINELKNEFRELLLSTRREGIADLLAWLEETDFYRLPAHPNTARTKAGF